MSLEVVTNGPQFGGVLDDLIKNYGPAADSFTVTLPKGEEFAFRPIADWSDLESLKAQAEAFAVAMSAGLPKWPDVGTPDKPTYRLAFLLNATCTSHRIGEYGWLKLAHGAAFLFEFIRKSVDAHQTAYQVIAEDQGVEAAKNESEATTGTETG